MTPKELKTMLDDGSFHHATYRNHGTLWEGLWIYRRSQTGWCGFDVAGCFNKTNPDLDLAERMVMVTGTGISIDYYGNG